MTPDLYGAWHTAGDWVIAHWPHLAAAATVAAFAWAVTRFIRRGHDDYRTSNDRAAADRIVAVEPRPEPGMPGKDDGLYLDCVAIYGDCEELDRLRHAIDQHRKEGL